MCAVCIQISTPLSLASFILPASLIAKRADSAKVKDGNMNVILRNYLVDRYTSLQILGKFKNSCLFCWHRLRQKADL
jgi:hypothetical protein